MSLVIGPVWPWATRESENPHQNPQRCTRRRDRQPVLGQRAAVVYKQGADYQSSPQPDGSLSPLPPHRREWRRGGRAGRLGGACGSIGACPGRAPTDGVSCRLGSAEQGRVVRRRRRLHLTPPPPPPGTAPSQLPALKCRNTGRCQLVKGSHSMKFPPPVLTSFINVTIIIIIVVI